MKFKKMISLACIFLLLVSVNTYAQSPTIPPAYNQVKYDFRAAWIATFTNINWPSKKGLTVEQQKKEYIGLVEQLQALKFNAVIMQVRPASDAFYPSSLNPWSEYLTGTQGTNPGYDPLKFTIDESHKRNLEFHAWFNPFRISSSVDLSKLSKDNVAIKHPDWVLSYGGKLYINPGIPEARAFVVESIMEVVKNYDIDAVHLDDYFYPYPGGDAKKTIPDGDTYKKYGRGINNIGDWRRDNVNLFVKDLSTAIKQTKSYVKFGISPFGIWQNKSVDPTGSDTSGMSAYSAIFADSRAWIKNGYLDYIMPQVYWEFGNKSAAYEKVLNFWINEMKLNPNMHLYIGHAAFKAGTYNEAWKKEAELPNQLKYNQSFRVINGSGLYNIQSVLDNNNFRYTLSKELYKNIALVPAMPWKTAQGSAQVTPPVLAANNRTITLRGQNTAAAYYVLYRSEGTAAIDTSNPACIYKTIRYNEAVQLFTDTNVAPGKTYNYVVTAMDRLHNESAKSNQVSLAIQ